MHWKWCLYRLGWFDWVWHGGVIGFMTWFIPFLSGLGVVGIWISAGLCRLGMNGMGWLIWFGLDCFWVLGWIDIGSRDGWAGG